MEILVAIPTNLSLLRTHLVHHVHVLPILQLLIFFLQVIGEHCDMHLQLAGFGVVVSLLIGGGCDRRLVGLLSQQQQRLELQHLLVTLDPHSQPF